LLRPAFALVAVASLVLAAAATAHVEATPPFLAAGSSDTVHLDVPNERAEPMTGFTVTVPDGFEIVHAHPTEGWDGSSDESTAKWTGGSLEAGASATFGIQLRTPSVPAVVDLEAVQRYDDGEVVRWPVAFTVTPADERSSGDLTLAAVGGLAGLLIVAAGAALLWRRRSGSLQEK
jgi:uncharacterized protein YcnI